MVIPLKPLYEYSSDVFSQNGEDGIIKTILEQLSITNGLVLEVGAHNGVFCSNTRNLYLNNENFKAILIEADTGSFSELINNSGKLCNTEVINKFIVADTDSEDSIDSIVSKSKFRNEVFVLASIDLDGPDFLVWSQLKAKPLLVIVETEVLLKTVENKANILDYINLGKQKGYTFLGMSGYAGRQAGNLIFLVDDYAEHFSLPEIHKRVLLSGGLPWEIE